MPKGSRVQVFPLTRNRIRSGIRQLWHRPIVIYETPCPAVGLVQVVDIGNERRLVVDGRPQSIHFPRGSADDLWHEYWGQVLRPPFSLTSRPRVLLFGLGGGTMIHLLSQDEAIAPASIDVVELSGEVIDVCKRFFGLDGMSNVTFHEGDIYIQLEKLIADKAVFDFVVEDVLFEKILSQPENDCLIRRTKVLTASGGIVVFHRKLMSSSTWIEYLARFEICLGEVFGAVRTRVIRNRSRSVLFFCQNDVVETTV